VLGYLKYFNFLVYDGKKILPTPLGKAAFASMIPPEHALKIFKDLAQSRKELVLENDLHLLYLTTPHFRNLREPNWECFIQKFKKLAKGEKRVADIYGIDIEYLYKATVYPPKLPAILQENKLPVDEILNGGSSSQMA